MTSRRFSLPTDYQEIGNERIRQAAAGCGATDVDIEWKGDCIRVTISGAVYVSSPLDEDGDEPSSTSTKGVDVAEVARAINAALDDDGVGLAIAEAHSVEVSTPGASDELSGIMFESYKGFDVLVDYHDKKKGLTRLEGRLVERNEQHTVINLKGRLKKIPNADVVSAKLPKAKKEKGAR